MSLVFFDTNILVYSADQRDPEKRRTAQMLIERHGDAGELVLSTQVLIEAFNVIRRKFGHSDEEAAVLVAYFGKFHVVATDLQLIFDAVQIVRDTGISIFDALILAAAAKAGCEVVYTEDLNAGQVIGGVRVVNPFVE